MEAQQLEMSILEQCVFLETGGRERERKSERMEILLASRPSLKFDKAVWSGITHFPKIAKLLCQHSAYWDSGHEVNDESIREACRIAVSDWLPGLGSAEEYVGVRRDVWQQQRCFAAGCWLPCATDASE